MYILRIRKNIQGDITGIYDKNVVLVAEYIYDAWGNHAVCSKPECESIACLNPFRYRGYYFDGEPELNLYYLNSRYYDATVGRFINADDVSELDPETVNGLNLYAYCFDNPVMLLDSTGHAAESIWEWIVGGIALVVGFVVSFIPGGQAIGAGLMFAGGMMILAKGAEVAGVESRTMSVFSGLASITAGLVLMFVPGLQGVGAGLIGSGIGSIAGGHISEAVGGSYEVGSAIGGMVGGAAVGAYQAYDAYKVSQIARHGAVAIGESMTQRVIPVANQYGAATYKGLSGYTNLSKIAPVITEKIGYAHNSIWINRVLRSGADVIIVGFNPERLSHSKFYIMELQKIFKYWSIF